ncbi:hypothetical protein V8C37DRAFT_364497 [Trichoderma ceciliae]
MAASGFERRDISHSQFGDNTVINQGNIYVHLPLPPARAEVVRIIPYHLNEDLVYRQDVVDQLDRLLPPSPGFYSAALWGLGGSGKTQIALDYAYRRCDDDECCVFWVHADSEATFASDYKTIGKKLGVVDESLDGPDLLDAVRNSIEARSRWVLILDNADDLALYGVGRTGGTEGMSESLLKFVPRGPQGTILWTSRDAHITGTLVGAPRGIEVPSMTKHEATALLAATMGEHMKPAVEELEIDRLLEELQRLPLAISQAGVYMRRTSTPVKEYLDLLLQGTSRWGLLKMTDSDRHRRPEVSNSVLETWKISIKRIREESELSYRILHVIAYLDNQEIPHELMAAASHISVDDEDEDGRPDTKLEVLQAVTRLVEFSFLHMRRAEHWRSYEMHKLVQEAVRYGLWVQGPGEKNYEAYFSSIALQIVDGAFPEQPTNSSWAQCEQYTTHAIQAGEWAEVSGKGVEASALLRKVSDFLYTQGRWREKEPVDRRVWSLRSEALGDKHPDTIASMAFLAVTYHNQGRYGEAERLTEQVLNLRREGGAFWEKHPDTINSMAELAVIYLNQGRYSEAEELAEQALNLHQETLGEKHPHTISSMANLASIYHIQGQYDKAKRLKEQVLTLHQEVLWEKHPDVIRSVANLAATYHNQGRYNEAEGLWKQALNLRREVLGEKHPDTVKNMVNLAILYNSMGRYGEAEGLEEQALSLLQDVLGEKHPDTIRVMANLGATYHSQGQYGKSKEILAKVLALQREVLGETHPDTMKSITDLGLAYHREGRYGEARETLNQVLRLQREVLGGKHPDTIKSTSSLGAVYYAEGKYDEAKDMLNQVINLQREALGEKHPSTIKSTADLGVVHHREGRFDEAEKVLNQVLGLQREVLGEKHPDTIKTMADLARCYYPARYGEAKELLVKVLHLRREVLGETHPDTMKTMANLATHYSRGRDDQQNSARDDEQNLARDDEQNPARDGQRKSSRRTVRQVLHDKAKIFKRWATPKAESE